MSVTEFAVLRGKMDLLESRAVRRAKWWEKTYARCSGQECPFRGKLWPAWLRTTAGVEFEGLWYCEIGCLKPVLVRSVQHLLSRFLHESLRGHRVPLGLLLVSRSVISPGQLRHALALQREAGRGRIGDWLRQLGMVSEQQVTAALGQQWSCPVFPLERLAASPLFTQILPLSLLDELHAVPAYASPSRKVLHLAFGGRIDHTSLYAIEQMLGCQTVACVAAESAIASLLTQFHQNAPGEETCFETVRNPREVAWTICSYAAQLRAVRLAVVRASSYIWVRFHRRDVASDLMFRIIPQPNAAVPDAPPGRANVFGAFADKPKEGVSHAPGPL